MTKALHEHRGSGHSIGGNGRADDHHKADRHAVDWRNRMSNNVAYALLVYTALQIFVTVHALRDGFPSIFPYIALVVLIAGIIPACRWFERRWVNLSNDAAHDPAMAGAFRRDQIVLWLMAIGLPIALTGLLKAIFAAA